MKTVYVRMTKKIIEGSLKGMVITNVLEAANEECAKRDVENCPKGSIMGGGWTGPRYEVLAHDYVIE